MKCDAGIANNKAFRSCYDFLRVKNLRCLEYLLFLLKVDDLNTRSLQVFVENKIT